MISLPWLYKYLQWLFQKESYREKSWSKGNNYVEIPAVSRRQETMKAPIPDEILNG